MNDTAENASNATAIIEILRRARDLQEQANALVDEAQELCNHKTPSGDWNFTANDRALVIDRECCVCGKNAIYILPTTRT